MASERAASPELLSPDPGRQRELGPLARLASQMRRGAPCFVLGPPPVPRPPRGKGTATYVQASEMPSELSGSVSRAGRVASLTQRTPLP